MSKGPATTERIQYTAELLQKRFDLFKSPPFSIKENVNVLALSIHQVAFELTPVGSKLHETIVDALASSCELHAHFMRQPVELVKARIELWTGSFVRAMGVLNKLQARRRWARAPRELRAIYAAWLEVVCPPLDAQEEERTLLWAARKVGYTDPGLARPEFIAELRSRVWYLKGEWDSTFKILYRKKNGTFGYRSKVILGRVRDAREADRPESALVGDLSFQAQESDTLATMRDSGRLIKGRVPGRQRDYIVPDRTEDTADGTESPTTRENCQRELRLVLDSCKDRDVVEVFRERLKTDCKSIEEAAERVGTPIKKVRAWQKRIKRKAGLG